MAFAWFNLGVRFVGGQFSDGMRRAGSQFHATVEQQKRDVAGLNREVARLEKAERSAAGAVRDAVKAHDARVTKARAALHESKREVKEIRDRIREETVAGQVRADKQSVPWKAWKKEYDAARQAFQAMNTAAHLQARLGKANVDNVRAERLEHERILATRKHRLTQDLSTARQMVASAKEALPTGAGAVNPARRAWEQRQAKFNRNILMADTEREGLRPIVRFARQGERAAKAALRSAVESQVGGGSAAVRAALASSDVTNLAPNEAAALARAASVRARTEARWTQNDIRRTSERLNRRFHVVARPDADSPELVQRRAELKSAEALRSSVQRELEIVDAKLMGERAESARQVAAAEAAKSRADVSARSLATTVKQRVVDLFTAQPLKDSTGGASASLVMRMRQALVGAIRTVRGDEGRLDRAKETPQEVTTAKALHEASKQSLEAGKDTRKAAQIKLAADMAYSHELGRVRTMLRGHIMGQLFDAVTQFALVRNAVLRFAHVAQKGAEFEYKAQGISTLEGASRGTGQDVFASYSRPNRYQTEVNPLEAIGRLGELSAAGYTRREMPDAASSIFDTLLAARGEITTSGAFDLGVSLDRAFGGNGATMRDQLDTALKAANQFPMTIGKIRDMMGYATEAAVTYGQPLEEMLMMGGMMMPINKTPSKTGTALRNALTGLVKPKAAKWLKKVGISTTDENGKMRLMGDIYLDIATELDKVEAAQGKQKRQALEYMIGGQRGGSTFAAIKRSTEGAAAASLRGTPFEGMKFATAKDAMEAMRLSISDAAGETRRMADEMRKTSFVLDLSFKASLERASIAAGSFLLPVRDAMQQMGKTLLDWVSSSLGGTQDTPGRRAAGSSFFGNVAGLAMTGVTAVTGGSAILGIVRALSQVKLLTQPKTIGAIADAMRAGGSITEAIDSTRKAGLITRMFGENVGLAASKVGAFAWNFLKWGGLIGGVIGGLVLAFHAADKAIVDFSEETVRRTQSRQTRMMKAMDTILTMSAEGRLKRDEKGRVGGWASEGERKAVLRGGAPAATLAQRLSGQDFDPRVAVSEFDEMMKAEMVSIYGSDPEKLKERLKEWNVGMENFMLDVGQEKFDAIIAGGGAAKLANIGVVRLHDQASAMVGEVRTNTKVGEEHGGALSAAVWSILQETGANNLREGLGKLGVLDRMFARMQLMKHYKAARGGGDYDPTGFQTLGYGIFGKNFNEEILAHGEAGGNLAFPTQRSQFDKTGNFFPRGRPDIVQASPLVSRLKDLLDQWNAPGGTDRFTQGSTDLKEVEALLKLINTNLVNLRPAAPGATANSMEWLKDLVKGSTRDLVPQ